MQREREAKEEADGSGFKRLGLAAVERMQTRPDQSPLLPSPPSPSPQSAVAATMVGVAEVEAEVRETVEAADAGQSVVGRDADGSRKAVNTSRLLRMIEYRKGKRHRQKQGWWRNVALSAADVLRRARNGQIDTSPLLLVDAVIDGQRCRDVLVDPGASSNFIRRDWAMKVGLPMHQLAQPVDVKLADERTTRLTHVVAANSVSTQGSGAACGLTVMDELSHQVILGMPWLRRARVHVQFGDVCSWNGVPMFSLNMAQTEEVTVAGLRLHVLTVAPEHQERMAKLLARYPSAFSKELRRRTPEQLVKSIKCEVRLRDPNCRPIRSRERRRSPKDEAALRQYTQEMLDLGIIQASNSEWVSQPVMVKKVRDGVVLDEKRPCWDFRGPNDLIIGDAHPLPLPENLFAQLEGQRLFSKMDLTKGFWQIPMHENSKQILAMSTPLGLMEPNSMPFGMKNAPAVFQREMQRVLKDRLGKGVLVFIDDILIYTKTVEEHEEMVEWVLQRLSDEGYYANPDKCEFFQREVSFLGHVVSERGVAVQQHKVRAVNEWPVPENKKQVRAFLGLTGYYHKFIPRYSEIALPLTNLTKDAVAFSWGAAEQRAFIRLKEKLTTADVLVHPNALKQYRLHTDASGYAVAAVLSQEQDDGTIRPIAYHSRKMSPAETRYPVHDQELLAIVRAVEEWRCYLEGSPHPILILTDHRGLEWISTKSELTGRQARWVEQLAELSYEVRWVPGQDNAVADALSRRVDLETQVAKDVEEDRKAELAPPTSEAGSVIPTPAAGGLPQSAQLARPRLHIQLGALPVVATAPVWQTTIHALPFKEKLQRAAAEDEWYTRMMEKSDPDDGLLRGDGLLWTSDGRVYVPDDVGCRNDLLHEVHDSPTGGHLGQRKTLAKLQSLCFWPGMSKDVEDYVRGCVRCAQVKPSQQPPAGLLHPLPIPSRPWETITMDFIGPLPKTSDYKDTILVVEDKFSKMAHFIPTTQNVTSKETAKLLIARVFCLHGVPTSIISDRDTRFTAKVWQEVMKGLGTKLAMSSSWHPQTDGQTERTNRVAEVGLRLYADKTGVDWAEWLPLLEAHYNSSKHESTGKTPFELNGTVWTDAMTLALQSPTTAHVRALGAEQLLEGLKTAWEDARMCMLAMREKMKRNADQHRTDVVYAVGDRALLSTKHIAVDQGKLRDMYVGPFTVTQVAPNGVNVWLDLPPYYRRLHQPFHVDRLKKYQPSVRGWERQQVDRPPPELVDGEPMYEVEYIFGKKVEREWVDADSKEEDDAPFAGTEVEVAAVTTRRAAAVAAARNDGAAPGTTATAGPPPAPTPRTEMVPARVRAQRKTGSRRKRQRRPGQWQLITRYHVKWAGFPVEEATWERADNLMRFAREAVLEYETQQAALSGEATLGMLCTHHVVQRTDVRGAASGGERWLLHSQLVHEEKPVKPSEAAGST